MVRGNFQKTVQVVDVDGSATCSDLAPYPLNPTCGGGGLLENTPVLCGSRSTQNATECYASVADISTNVKDASRSAARIATANTQVPAFTGKKLLKDLNLPRAK